MRQGAATGPLALAPGTSPWLPALGVYELDGGGGLAVADYSRLGVPPWTIDLRSGAFHALFAAGGGFDVGPGVGMRQPSQGRLVVSGDTLTWGALHATRFAVRQEEVRFRSGRAMLASTLSIPPWPGPHPAAVFVHGAGVSLRDDGQFPQPLERPLADIEADVRALGPSGFDPAPVLRTLRIPILWLYGGFDRNQPTDLDLPVLERLRAETGADFTWRVFPRGNHWLFQVETGLRSELAASPGVAPGVIDALAEWLHAHGLDAP